MNLSMIRIVLTGMIGMLISAPLGAGEGQRLYQNHCARCHGDTGTGDGPAFTMQRPWPRDFTQGQFKYRSTPLETLPTQQDIEKVIRQGALRTSMPGFKNLLSESEMSLIAAYVLELAKGSGLPDGTPDQIMAPVELDAARPASGRLESGRAAYHKYGCVACHGEDARGLGPLAQGLKDENGFWISPADLTDRLTYGGGHKASDIYMRLVTGIALSPMLNYTGVIPDAEARNIALYVASLQRESSDRQLLPQDVWRMKLSKEAQGEYMLRAMSCSLCHNSYDATGHYHEDLYLAGGVGIHLPGLGTFPTQNITSHPEYGIGKWTTGQIVQAMMTGHAPDRRLEAFAMPWVFFSHLDTEDAEAIAVYLKTLPPIANNVPRRKYQPMGVRLWHRLRQLVGLEKGRLEYPPGNKGKVEAE